MMSETYSKGLVVVALRSTSSLREREVDGGVEMVVVAVVAAPVIPAMVAWVLVRL